MDPAGVVGDSLVVQTLRAFAGEENRAAPITINFHFNLTPAAFLGDERLRVVQFRSRDDKVHELPAQLAVTCIGYESVPCGEAIPVNGVLPNKEGQIREGLYVVGWAKRGPSGTIPTNRSEAQQLAQKMAQEVTEHDCPGGAALRQMLAERQVRWLDYAAWRRIDAAELACADRYRCRQKFSSLPEMLEAAQLSSLLSER
jgi:ferredoxin--NADP+ reductase